MSADQNTRRLTDIIARLGRSDVCAFSEEKPLIAQLMATGERGEPVASVGHHEKCG
jgi:hypothetical protein